MITVDLPIDIYETAGDLAAKFHSRGSKDWLNMRDEISIGMFTERTNAYSAKDAELTKIRGYCGQLIDMYDFNSFSREVCDEDNDLVEHIRDALASETPVLPSPPK